LGRLRIMIGILAVAACLAGCATTYVRPGDESSDDLGRDNDLRRDNVECQFEASKLTSSAGMEGVAAEQKRAELEALCMQARGWSRQ
jgi:5-methylcytosine-specific restriction endonuclease McrA